MPYTCVHVSRCVCVCVSSCVCVYACVCLFIKLYDRTRIRKVYFTFVFVNKIYGTQAHIGKQA